LKAESAARKGEKTDFTAPKIEPGHPGHILFHLHYEHTKDVLSISIIDSSTPSAGTKNYCKIRRLPQSDDVASSWRTDRQHRDNDAVGQRLQSACRLLTIASHALFVD